MKKTSYYLLFLLAAFLCLTACGCSGQVSFETPEKHKVHVEDPENGTAYAVSCGERTESAAEGERLSVVCLPDTGYELKSILVNGEEIQGASFSMEDRDVTVSVEFQAVTHTISVLNTEGGTVSCDKTSAKYGEEVTLTIIPDKGKYGIENSLSVNNSEIYRGRILKETRVSFFMPHTDAQISMSFADDGITGNGIFGDYSMDIKARQPEKWNYSGTTLEDSNVSISLNGTGDANSQRDIAYTFCAKQSDYFMFSVAARVSGFVSDNTYPNNVGVFFGDGDAMGRIGYSITKYSARSDVYIRRNFTSVSFKTGEKRVLSGFLAIMAGQKDDGTDDTVSNSQIPTSSYGIPDIAPADLQNKTMRMGFVYDAANKKIHILMSGFDPENGYDDKLVYVRTIDDLDGKYYTSLKNGQVNFGLYADAAGKMKVSFFDFKYSANRAEIEALFPEIKNH